MWVGNQTRLTESEDEITRSLPVLGQNQNRQKGGHRWADPEQRHMGQNNWKKHLIPTHRADWPPSIDRQMVKSHPKSIPKMARRTTPKTKRNSKSNRCRQPGWFRFQTNYDSWKAECESTLGARSEIGRARVGHKRCCWWWRSVCAFVFGLRHRLDMF